MSGFQRRQFHIRSQAIRWRASAAPPSAGLGPDKPSFTKWLGQESAADKSGGEQSRVMPGPARFAHCTRFRHFAPVAEAYGCSPKRGLVLPHLWQQLNHIHSTINAEARKAPSLTSNPWPLAPAVLGGRAYSALPCAGAEPPQRPLSYNMPSGPGVDIGDGCLIESVQPDHVPPVPSNYRRCRPCACPGTRSHPQRDC